MVRLDFRFQCDLKLINHQDKPFLFILTKNVNNSGTDCILVKISYVTYCNSRLLCLRGETELEFELSEKNISPMTD